MASGSFAAPARDKGARRRAAQAVLMMVAWVGGQFLGAWRLDWTRGWIAAVSMLVPISVVAAIVRRTNPGLMAERAHWRRPDTKSFDKWFVLPIMVLSTCEPFVAGWEAGCARCQPLPFGTLYPGVAMLILGFALVGWVMAVNRHAESTVRIQTDRGHTVVTRGPYRFVRHPMYVGSIVMFAGMPLVWGARLWVPIVSAVISTLYIVRTVFEDRTLRRELAGYEQYTAVTRYRLVPGLW